MVLLNPEATRELTPYLGLGEQLLWSGRPRQGVVLRTVDVVLIPITLLLTAWAYTWEYATLRAGDSPWWSLWGVLYVLLTTHLLVGRFFWSAHERAKTYYGLSNTDIVIMTTAFGREVKSLPLNALLGTRLSKTRGHGGTIALEFAGVSPNAPLDIAYWQQRPRLAMIEHAGDVLALVDEARRAVRIAPQKQTRHGTPAVEAAANREVSLELTMGEQLAWAGVPRQGLRLRRTDMVMIPVSLVWAAGVLGAVYAALTRPSSAEMKITTLLFVLVGIYLVIGRFFVDARMRSRTYYGISDERAVIVSGAVVRRVTSIPLGHTVLRLSERADGSGSIALGWRINALESVPGASIGGVAPCFDMIEHAREVFTRLRSSQ